ncbi:MAG: hypothetical protein PUF71_03085 [Firmicutes bacterium]|nr:hypothetical protein [Bacillota bacterium]
MILGYVFADKLRTTAGVVATCVFCLVAFSGLLPAKDVLAVMSNANITLIVSMFVVAAGFNRTQAVHKMSNLVYRISGGNFKTALAGYILLTFALTQFVPSPMAAFAIIAPMATPAIPVVMEHGGYDGKDLLKMGWLPSIIIAVTSVLIVMTVFPAY